MSANVLRLVANGRRIDEDTASIPDQLRSIASDVEEGALMGARAALVVIDGPDDSIMVYGIGPGSPQMRLNAAYMLLALASRELEIVATKIRE